MIGLLNAYQCDPVPKDYQIEYGRMFLAFLKENLPDVEIKVYKVALGEWPRSVTECAGWIITGSPKGAYEQDEWIVRLARFVQDCHSQKQKLVGVCFGHQLIAQALGGKAEKSHRGWGVGVQDFAVRSQKSWMTPSLQQCSLLFSHQDQVTRLPAEAIWLAESQFCPYQMYSIGDHIFSMQGHPEFTPDFVKGRLDSRIELLGKELHQSACSSLTKPTQSRQIATWIKNFLLGTFKPAQ